jgi:hypothetical protein
MCSQGRDGSACLWKLPIHNVLEPVHAIAISDTASNAPSTQPSLVCQLSSHSIGFCRAAVTPITCNTIPRDYWLLALPGPDDTPTVSEPYPNEA